MHRSPAAFGLGQPVGDDVEGLQVVAVSEVAAVHLDVLGQRCGQAGAALPRDDAVGFAVDAGGGRGQRLLAGDPGRLGDLSTRIPAGIQQAPQPPCVAGLVVAAERAPRVMTQRTSSGQPRASSRA